MPVLILPSPSALAAAGLKYDDQRVQGVSKQSYIATQVSWVWLQETASIPMLPPQKLPVAAEWFFQKHMNTGRMVANLSLTSTALVFFSETRTPPRWRMELDGQNLFSFQSASEEPVPQTLTKRSLGSRVEDVVYHNHKHMFEVPSLRIWLVMNRLYIYKYAYVYASIQYIHICAMCIYVFRTGHLVPSYLGTPLRHHKPPEA